MALDPAALRSKLDAAGVNVSTLTPQTLPAAVEKVGLSMKGADASALLANVKSVAPKGFVPGSPTGTVRNPAGAGQVALRAAGAAPAADAGALPSAAAYAKFEAAFKDALANGNSESGGGVARLSPKEVDALEKLYTESLGGLPDSPNRARYLNGIAALIAGSGLTGVDSVTGNALQQTFDKALQESLNGGPVDIDAYKQGGRPSGVSLGGVKTGADGNDVLEAVLGCHLRDGKTWTISQKDADGDSTYKPYVGNVVRIVAAEGNRLETLMKEIFAVLPAGNEREAFFATASELFKQPGSKYEIEKKFPNLLHRLQAARDNAQ